MPHFPPLKNLTRHKKTINEDKSGVNIYDQDGEYVSKSPESKLGVLGIDKSKLSSWQQAWEHTKAESGWEPPIEWHIESLNLTDEVRSVAEEARLRAIDAETKERTLGGSTYTYRQVFDNVANWANKFQRVGDLVVQADPGYATLPWAMIRFAISTFVGESETYHRMLEGTEFVSQLITQYPVIEQTYARVDSDLAAALRKTLFSLYVVILRFQIRAIQYFDQEKKGQRTLQGVNPVSADDIQQERLAIDHAKDRVDHDVALVHSDITKRGIDELVEGKENLLSGQQDLLANTRDGILALAQKTGSSFRAQNEFIGGKFDEVEARNQKRNDAILEIWKEPLNVLSSALEDERIEREKQELRDIRRWLSVAEPETNYYNARGKRRLTLGDWLLMHPEFDAWERSQTSSKLWLYGFAGTGKTGLVCRVIDHLRKGGNDEEFGRLAFFFCSNDKAGTGRAEDFSRSDPEEALRAIVSQIAVSQESRSAATIVQEMYAALGPHSDKHRRLSYPECVDILVAISKEMPIMIILDALDELDQDKSPALLRYLQDVIDRSPGKVKVFISTRSFPAIANELSEDQSIEVTAENNGDDVRAFIKQTLQDRIDEGAILNGNVSDQLRANIENTLTSRAHNMFLYASLLLNQLCDRNRNDDEESIKKKLNELPKNLTDVYNRIMEQIHDDKNNSARSCRLAQDTFKWLLHTQETLLCDFLLEAISPTERETDVEEVLHACRTLVVKGKVLGKDVFEFAHYSVREHVSTMEEYSSSKCHLTAAQSCLRVLNVTFGADRQKIEVSESQKLFSDYALLYWPLHYEGIQKEDMNEHRPAINAMLRTFLLRGRSRRDKYADWFAQAQQMVKRLKDGQYLTSKLNHLQATPPTPLFAACVFGLDDLIGRFGRELNGLNKSNAQGQTALCLAIENNKYDVVKALLSRRFPADLNLLNVKAVQQFEDCDPKRPPETIIYASALQCAAASGRSEMVDFLIKKGAHIDLVAGYYGSSLQAAALRGHEDVVSLLLSKGAEPNSQGGFHGNALQAAAAGGYGNIINLLLENKPPALVDTPGGHYGSALMAAICSGNSDAVWALLEERANPNLRAKAYDLPLAKAATMGQAYKEIVSLLLDNHAEADLSPKGSGVHILHLAAMYNMIDLAEHCLLRGCKIDMITTEGPWYPRRYGDFSHEMTPLAYACAEGHVEMADFLLWRGAPFELENPNAALLWITAYQGHASVADLLLRRFKASHSKEEVTRFFLKRPSPRSGHPILFAAASSGNADVVRVLLDHGAKYEANWYNATPLLATATFRCPEVADLLLEYHRQGKIDVCINKQANNLGLKLLLRYDADYNIAGHLGNNPLLLAAPCGNDEIINALLTKVKEDHPDEPQKLQEYINRQNGDTQTALFRATDGNKSSTVQLLLTYGADYTIATKSDVTVLHHASFKGFESIISILLGFISNSANPASLRAFLDRRNDKGNTALWDACDAGYPEIVALLLTYGANYTIADNFETTPLHIACSKGQREVVIKLLDFISKDTSVEVLRDLLNHRNKNGRTALIHACEFGRPIITTLLLDHGVDYSNSDKDGFTALHYCTYRNKSENVQILLEKASKDQTDNGNKFRNFLNQRGTNNRASALGDAARQGYTELAKLLLDYGAEWDSIDSQQKSPLHYAVAKGNNALFKVVLEAGKRETEKTGDKERLRRCVNQKDKNRGGLWEEAARRGNTEIMEALRGCGVLVEGM
ncbi:hypothetical protein P7C71_g3166, partial [Lecanoromycetidae sp. Uapishka_2]